MRSGIWILAGLMGCCCTPRTVDSRGPAVAPPTPRQAQLEADRIAQAVTLLLAVPPDTQRARKTLEPLSASSNPRHRQIAQLLVLLIDQRTAYLQSRAAWIAERNDLARRLELEEKSLSDLRGRIGEEHGRATKLGDECARLARKLEESKQEIERQNAELEGLRKELEALKSIDLQRAP